MSFKEPIRTIINLNIPQALVFFTTWFDVDKSKKFMKDIMFWPMKDLSKAYDQVKYFIAIDDAMGSLKQ